MGKIGKTLSCFFLCFFMLFLFAAKKQPEKKIIFIDLESLTLSLYENNVLTKTYKIAAGKYKTPTPVGSWRIKNKSPGWSASFGSHFMGLDVPWGIYGIHGTNHPESIGNNASHGCIRMGAKDIADLYGRCSVGMRVVIEQGVYGEMAGEYRSFVLSNTGAQVMLVQKRLRQLGFLKGRVSGVMDHTTQNALKAYGKDIGRSLGPNIGKDTYEALGLILFE